MKTKFSTKLVFLSGLFSLLQAFPIIAQPKPIYSGNPILPGEFADPCLVVHQDTFYIYATTSDTKDAIVWRSADFVNWRLTKLNWPTTALGGYIWAPAVVKGLDGKFYFYSSVESRILVGVANHPAGPFQNALPEEATFIKNRAYWDVVHTIDADCFIDDDGSAYLYWGSGFDFKNGQCVVAELNKDMASFKGEPKLITPSGYFEGPHMLKRNGKYYLMYSDGLYYNETYKVRYAVSNSPLGPFVEGKNSPILTASADKKVLGPGHHYTIQLDGQHYIIYHKLATPVYGPGTPIRQVCIDLLQFDEEGAIKKVIPTDMGVPITFTKGNNTRRPLPVIKASASATLKEDFMAKMAFDNQNGTLWAAPNKSMPVWLKADFGKAIEVAECEPVFDLIMGDYQYRIEYSTDDKNWELFAEANNGQAKEWPVRHRKEVKARYMRITVLNQTQEKNRIGLWEFNVYGRSDR